MKILNAIADAAQSAASSIQSTFASMTSTDSKVDKQKEVLAQVQPPSKIASIFQAKKLASKKQDPAEVEAAIHAVQNQINHVIKRSPKGATIRKELENVLKASDTVEKQIDNFKKRIDQEIAKKPRDADMLLAMALFCIMLTMRKEVKTDQEIATSYGNQILVETDKTAATYNTWTTLTITIVAGAVGVAGGVAGSAILMPSKYIATETARALNSASTSISGASTALSSVGSLASNSSERTRTVLQMTIKRLEHKEEDRKSAKHSNNDSKKSALDSLKGVYRDIHDAIKSALS